MSESLSPTSSSISYQPPPATPHEEHVAFSDNLTEAISAISDEYNPTSDDHESHESSGSSEPTEPTEPAELTEATEPLSDTADEKASDDPVVARGLERLIQREVALQQRESAFQAALQQYDAMKAELAQYKAKPTVSEHLDKLDHSPSAALKALGKDPQYIVRLMIAEQLQEEGKEVPAPLRQALQDAEYKRRDVTTNEKIKELEAKLAQKEAAQTAEMHFNGIKAGAHEYIQGLAKPDVAAKAGKAMPEVTKLAAVNAETLHNEIMEEIVKDARQRMATDPNGAPLTYEAAAKLVEAKLARYKSLLGPQNVQPTKQASGARTSPPQPKPPIAPLKPWQMATNELDAALKEAEREFYRSESALKARR